MSGILIMVGDSISTGSLFGNLVALVIPINFAIYVMIIRKNSNLDMVPAMLYSGIFSLIYGAILSKSFEFSSHDLFMGFLLGVPQLAFGFICVTIGTKTTKAVTVGLLMLLETISAPIWVWILFGEQITTWAAVGGALIFTAIFGLALNEIYKQRSVQP